MFITQRIQRSTFTSGYSFNFSEALTLPDARGNQKVVHMKITAHSQDSVKLLQEVFKRACNTWDDAPPEVKELHDLIVHGSVLQQYNTKIGTLETQGNMIPPAVGKGFVEKKFPDIITKENQAKTFSTEEPSKNQ